MGLTGYSDDEHKCHFCRRTFHCESYRAKHEAWSHIDKIQIKIYNNK